MWGDHKAKKAAEASAKRARASADAYDKAFNEWLSERDSYAQLIDLAKRFTGAPVDGLVLKAGEAVFCSIEGAALIEERRGPGHYQGGSQGVSIPIGSIGGRSIRYRVGASRGHFVQGAPTPTAIDTGTLYVTNQRVIFQGANQTRECAFSKLIGFRHLPDGSTTFSVSNRQKPTTVRYGPDVAAAFEFRLDLALAHFQGDPEGFVARLENQLAQIDAEKPTPPLPPEEAPRAAEHPPEHGPGQRAATPPGGPAAGWYPDPWHRAELRWWDGTQWTGSTHPGPV